jgi:hypothetical protein
LNNQLPSENKFTPSVKVLHMGGIFFVLNMMEQNGGVLLFDWEMGGNCTFGL